MGKRISFFRRCFMERKIWQLYLLILLPFIFVLVFSYIPMAGVTVAFKDYSIRRGIWGSEWMGLRYFKQLFNTPIFSQVFVNTLTLSLLSLIIGFPFPILLALAFHEIRNKRFKKISQTLSFAPYFISTVVVVSIMTQIFSYRYGIVNSFLNLFGIPNIDFFGATSFFRPAYILSGIWQGAGYGSVLYLAALSGIDPTLYEAAQIDGASRFQILLHINIPGIMSTIIINLILNTGSILSVGYEKVLLLQNPVNYTISEVISTYVYKVGIVQSQFSFATAAGLFNSVINCIVLLMVNTIARKVGETSLF